MDVLPLRTSTEMRIGPVGNAGRNDAYGGKSGTMAQGGSCPAMKGEPEHEVPTGIAHAALVHPVSYRGDIDGLRAISVAAVILFHMLPHHFRAGGIGVDVFFVISGYLIGGIILASAEADRFSYADFYLRRIRRIVPAFLAAVIATMIAGLLLLYPWELKGLAASALAALGCGGNIYFYLTSDYFAAASETLPLLHTWTLGVEEQFYFLFPLLALPAHRLAGRRAWLPLLLVLGCLSFAVSEVQARAGSPAGFYLLPGRGWELLAGVAATRVPARWFRREAARSIAGAAGLLLILASLALLEPARRFPGLMAVPPCLGAVLLLVSGQSGSSPVHRLLSLAPLRWTGLASYSLYLWHWPIIVFFKMERVVGKLSLTDLMVVSGLIAIAGFGSWHFIERPFRARTMAPRRLLAWCGGLLAVAVALPVAVFVGEGMAWRFPPQAIALARASLDQPRFVVPDHKCFLIATDRIADYDAAHCLSSQPGKRNWLLIGDSHAAMFYGGLVRRLPNIHWQSAVVYGCEVRIDAPASAAVCDTMMHRIFSEHLARARIDGVVLTSRWTNVEPEKLTRLAQQLRLHGIALVVLGPAPEYSVPVGRILAESLRRRDPELPVRLLETRLWTIDAELAGIARESGFVYASPMAVMCPGRRACELARPHDVPLYFDSNHLNAVGSDRVVRQLLAATPGMARAFAAGPATAR
jgi:peptidoglycan/LPS O-acetylase OafA/YrhL